jgi:hypothetical protein
MDGETAVSLLLVVVSLAYLGSLAAIEAWCVLSDRPTISRRIQAWVQANYQIAIALASVAGWLICHFSGTPG